MPYDITKLDPQVIIFGGLTLVSLYLAFILYKSNKVYFNHTNDTFQQVAKSNIEIAKQIQRNSDVIHTLKDTVSKNTEILDKHLSK